MGNVSLCSARIMTLNQEIVKNDISEEKISKILSNIRSVRDAKVFIRKTIKELDGSIGKNYELKKQHALKRNAYLEIKSKFAKLEDEKSALATSFEKKLLHIQSEHEEHMP